MGLPEIRTDDLYPFRSEEGEASGGRGFLATDNAASDPDGTAVLNTAQRDAAEVTQVSPRSRCSSSSGERASSFGALDGGASRPYFPPGLMPIRARFYQALVLIHSSVPTGRRPPQCS